MGAQHLGEVGFSILYRGFQHGDLRKICEAVAASSLNTKYRTALRRPSLSQDMRDFASAFPSLQEARHMADYDPAIQFDLSDAVSLVDAAATAIDAFDRADVIERTDLLALMMVGTRH